ncbi:MAG TPA: oxygen-independent coproporphyrinogen III oxidase [Candidatus Pullilachnospira stercoravium]|uniref:Heme chaperone HemW n=1 Tax=Candidatus Pullilachnospira stercoravium TaxID=2840913 RepID=A0A9D1T7X1_9FIRM|nr:oxygen-independent coproporphyrinogen III oxidase [Candidatus Pullilachnospira stercoravium]
MREIQLYLHIPFCIRKCGYCDFLSGPADETAQRAYTEALLREIRVLGQRTEAAVSTIFIGGGTPSVLRADWMEEILDQLRTSFRLLPEAEISMEANPGTVTPEKLKAYLRGGVNRISFGCQSADNEELWLLGRIHSWEEFLESFSMAREAGFANINVDLMSGLPGQTVASWERTLRRTAALGPEHISAYSLIIEEGTPFAQRPLPLPDEEEERLMYERTGQILKEYGMEQYEISNYARPGYACRHNIGYWTGKEYLGMGLGSSSLMEGERFSNTSDMKEYLEDSGHPGRLRRDRQKLSEKDRMEEFMFLGLRMTAGISEKDFLDTFGREIHAVYGPVIRKYVEGGFLGEEKGRLYLTRKGISVSNPILADFLLD